MSKWVAKPVAFEVDFDGDHISITADRLKIKDMSALVGKRFDLSTPEGQMGVCEIGAEILPKYLKTFDGLIDADGNAISLDVYLSNLDEFYFAPLTASILLNLIGASSIKGNEKN